MSTNNKNILSQYFILAMRYIVIKQYNIFAALHSEESIYDTPPSNQRASEQEHGVCPPHLSLSSSTHSLPRSPSALIFPISETAESISDSPTYVFKKKSVNGKWNESASFISHDVYYCVIACDFVILFGPAEGSCARERPEVTSLLQDMVTCLGGNTADLFRATAPGTICQP